MTSKNIKVIASTFFISLLVATGLLSKQAFSIMIFQDPVSPISLSTHRAVISYDEKSKTETLVVSPEFNKSEPKKLVAYWKFDEGAGTSIGDSSGYMNSGTWLGNSLTTADTWSSTVKLSGHSGEFDGVYSYANFPHNNIYNNLSGLTVSAWVYMTKAPSEGSSYLIANKEGNFRLSVGPTSAHFVVATTANYWYSVGTVAESINKTCAVKTWCHIVGTYDGTYTGLYINGELVASGVSPVSGNVQDSYVSFTLGIGSLTGTDYFSGYMDEAKIYNYALTADEIESEYADVSSGNLQKISSPRPIINKPKSTYGLLMPVPSKPEVTVVKDTLFTALADLTTPAYLYNKPVPMLGINGFGATDSSTMKVTSPVNVVESKKADVYDILVIEPTQEDGLQKWFTDNGYKVSDSANFIIKDYASKGYYFVLAKVNLDAFGGSYNQQLSSGHVNPLKLTFKSDSILYPIKLTGDSLTSNTNAAQGVQLDIVEYAPASPTYYPTPTYSAAQNFVVYTIMDAKAYIPGFTVEYAGNVTSQQLEKLATQENNTPWEKFSGRKYLTKLSRLVPVSEMHNDIVVVRADDNKAVGSGTLYTLVSQPVKIALIVLVPIALEVIVFVFIHLRRKK